MPKNTAKLPRYGIRYTSGCMQGKWINPTDQDSWRNQDEPCFPWTNLKAARNFLRNYAHRIKYETVIITQTEWIARMENMRKRFETAGK